MQARAVERHAVPNKARDPGRAGWVKQEAWAGVKGSTRRLMALMAQGSAPESGPGPALRYCDGFAVPTASSVATRSRNFSWFDSFSPINAR